MLEHAYLIPLIPLAASLVMLLGAKASPRSKAPFLGIAAMLWCLIQSLAIFYSVARGTVPLPFEANIEWFRMPADAGGRSFAFSMPLGVLIDGPAAVMLVVVTLVSSLVQIYSLAYARDPICVTMLPFSSRSMLGLVVWQPARHLHVLELSASHRTCYRFLV